MMGINLRLSAHQDGACTIALQLCHAWLPALHTTLLAVNSAIPGLVREERRCEMQVHLITSEDRWGYSVITNDGPISSKNIKYMYT